MLKKILEMIEHQLGDDSFAAVLYRRMSVVAAQTALLIAVYYCSFLLRFDGVLPTEFRRTFLYTLAPLVAAKVASFCLFGLTGGWWRYVGTTDLLNIVKGSSAASVVFAVVLHLVPGLSMPRSVLAIDLALTICALGGARIAVRLYRERIPRQVHSHGAKRTVIVGAGHAGTTFARELLHNPDLGYEPVVFIDDDASKLGLRFHGIKVAGATTKLNQVMGAYRANCVLIAIPSANGSHVEQILKHCRNANVEVKILHPISQRLNGGALSQIRAVRVEDLLGREPVRLDHAQIERQVRNKVVLITGAGGSIGSELSRHVASFGPAHLILLDRAESPLFEVSTGLAYSAPHVKCTPVIGDIIDVGMLRDFFTEYRPNMVFHTAAYKHVPMMEQNCCQAVTNNVFGTYNVAMIARQCGADSFVLISTDKAVNPTNIMGVTKRIGELIVLALNGDRTRFIAVRFGNVLGSNGSVVPIFEQQIARGGPVTVTHENATRFLMTIPEAVQLVLQATTIASRNGQIFMLQMGKPVRILDLAENMIRLSGLTPGKNIKIVFSGLRPGEKLVEELSSKDEGGTSTSHERICALDGRVVALSTVRLWLNELSPLVEAKNIAGLVAKLKEIVPEYVPSPMVIAMCELDRHDFAWRYRRASATLSAVSDAA